jgi:hypothetical protein
MFQIRERKITAAVLILNLEDAYARERMSPNSHPRPFEPLLFQLVRMQAAGNGIEFDPPLQLEVIRNQNGYHLFFGKEILANDPSRSRNLPGPVPRRDLNLPAGKYTLRVSSPLYQTAEKVVTLPMSNPNLPGGLTNTSLDLNPGYAYPFPDAISAGAVAAADCTSSLLPDRNGPTLLRGTLLDTYGKGIPGAKVQVSGRRATYITDPLGSWVLWFNDERTISGTVQNTGPVAVRFEIPNPDGSTRLVSVPNICVARGYETSLRQTALRGRVLRKGVGVADAVISVAGLAEQSGSDLDGNWMYVFPFSQAAGKVDVTASLPGGPGLPPKSVDVVPGATLVIDPFVFA